MAWWSTPTGGGAKNILRNPAGFKEINPASRGISKTLDLSKCRRNMFYEHWAYISKKIILVGDSSEKILRSRWCKFFFKKSSYFEKIKKFPSKSLFLPNIFQCWSGGENCSRSRTFWNSLHSALRRPDHPEQIPLSLHKFWSECHSAPHSAPYKTWRSPAHHENDRTLLVWSAHQNCVCSCSLISGAVYNERKFKSSSIFLIFESRRDLWKKDPL